MIRKRKKTAFKFELTRHSNSYFSNDIGWTSFIKVTLTTLYLSKSLRIEFFHVLQNDHHSIDWPEMLENAIFIVNFSIFKLKIF